MKQTTSGIIAPMNTTAAAKLSLQIPPPLTPPPPQRLNIAYTTPSNYADRLSSRLIHHLHLHHPNPPNLIWTPTVIIQSTPHTISSLTTFFSNSNLDDFSAIAFTSRSGITAISTILQSLSSPPPLSSTVGDKFTISALGKDADLLDSNFISKLCPGNPSRIEILVPEIATPKAMAESLGLGFGRKVICPVPKVEGLSEPRVVPDFLEDLVNGGWVPVRVSAYETRWAGRDCAVKLLEEGEREGVDAIVFTSTAEVEGLLKSLRELGAEWGKLRKRWPDLVVAAHGPVTAAGAQGLGVAVDVVGEKFGSFDGIAEALAMELTRRKLL